MRPNIASSHPPASAAVAAHRRHTPMTASKRPSPFSSTSSTNIDKNTNHISLAYKQASSSRETLTGWLYVCQQTSRQLFFSLFRSPLAARQRLTCFTATSHSHWRAAAPRRCEAEIEENFSSPLLKHSPELSPLSTFFSLICRLLPRRRGAWRGGGGSGVQLVKLKNLKRLCSVYTKFYFSKWKDIHLLQNCYINRKAKVKNIGALARFSVHNCIRFKHFWYIHCFNS